MNNDATLNALTKEQLIELIELYSKSCYVMDGVWFQTVERKYGMEEAVFHDQEAWKGFTVSEAKKIKSFLHLPEQAGLEGLAKALSLRYYANLNKDEIRISGNTLTYRMVECRVQTARQRKNMPFHPCKPVGIIEYSEFARTIDSRITCECLSCYPDVKDPSCCCAWLFTLKEEKH